MDEENQPASPEGNEQALSKVEERMMGYVASVTGAPEKVSNGQSGQVLIPVEDDPTQQLQPNQVNVAYSDEDTEPDKTVRHSSITGLLVLPEGALQHQPSSNLGETLYRLVHDYDATSRTGQFKLSFGEVEAEVLLDESIATRLLDGLDGSTAAGRMQLPDPPQKTRQE